MKTENFFVEENRGPVSEVISPSGKYRLEISQYTTRQGCWSYSQGRVFDVKSGNLIQTVNRNYSSFPYTFVENHKNGHDYLVCGEDYQGQTVIELDTGVRKEYLEESAKKGAGFCFIDSKPNSTGDLLVVYGCYWACPDEVRVYDFSDPLNSLNEIEFETKSSDFWYFTSADFEADGRIKFVYEAEIDDDSDDENEEYKMETRQYTVFEVADSKLRVVEQWIDPAEVQLRKDREEATARFKQEMQDFRENNELFLEIKRSFPDASLAVGQTYKDWHPEKEFSDRRACVDLFKTDSGSFTVDWGFVSAPIKFTYYKFVKGERKVESTEIKFYDLCLENMKTVIEYAKSLKNE